jgi:hypothetical protein
MSADMAELVDAPDLGSGFARSEGSIPFIRIENVCSTDRNRGLTVVKFTHVDLRLNLWK